MAQPEKIQKVDEISDVLKGANGVFLTDFSGITVEEITKLRREFRKVDVEYVVVKNTLAKLSAEKVGLGSIVPFLSGPTGMAIAKDDPIAPVRVIMDFRKTKKELLSIKTAYVEGQILSQAQAEELKNIPTRDVLLGQVVSTIASPISKFVGGLNALLGNLVYALDAIKEKKDK